MGGIRSFRRRSAQPSNVVWRGGWVDQVRTWWRGMECRQNRWQGLIRSQGGPPLIGSGGLIRGQPPPAQTCLRGGGTQRRFARPRREQAAPRPGWGDLPGPERRGCGPGPLHICDTRPCRLIAGIPGMHWSWTGPGRARLLSAMVYEMFPRLGRVFRKGAGAATGQSWAGRSESGGRTAYVFAGLGLRVRTCPPIHPSEYPKKKNPGKGQKNNSKPKAGSRPEHGQALGPNRQSREGGGQPPPSHPKSEHGATSSGLGS